MAGVGVHDARALTRVHKAAIPFNTDIRTGRRGSRRWWRGRQRRERARGRHRHQGRPVHGLLRLGHNAQHRLDLRLPQRPRRSAVLAEVGFRHFGQLRRPVDRRRQRPPLAPVPGGDQLLGRLPPDSSRSARTVSAQLSRRGPLGRNRHNHPRFIGSMDAARRTSRLRSSSSGSGASYLSTTGTTPDPRRRCPVTRAIRRSSRRWWYGRLRCRRCSGAGPAAPDAGRRRRRA